MPLPERLPRPPRWTEQQLEFRGEYRSDLRLTVVPRHRHTARPMCEIRQIEIEVALIADMHELTNPLREDGFAVRGEPHDLELVAVLRKPEELRQREVEHA